MNKRLRANRRLTLKNFSSDIRAVRIKTETNKAGAIKKISIIALILLQLAILIYLHVSFVTADGWWIGASFVMSLLTCIYVLSSNKNGLSKAVWIIFLLVCFVFAVPIFWLSDERIFFRKAKKRYDAVFKRTEDYQQVGDEIIYAENCVQNHCKYLFNTGKFCTYTDSTVNYFSSGTLLFDDVLNRIKEAKKFIFIEFFIVADGVLMDRFYDILAKKVAEGVDVRLIYDDMGSKGPLSNKMKKRLKKAGVKIKPFNKLVPLFLVGLNYRDHRKIVVVDGQTAYTGGSNLADEYVNEKRMHGYWKDTGVRIDGKAVDGLTLIFLRQWETLSRVKEDYSAFINLFTKIENKSAVVPYADGLDYAHPIGKGVYENVISSAEKFLFIMTPYFIIDDGMTDLIIKKALSGVDVKIILPGVPDKPFVYSVTRANAEKLIDYGVKVYVVPHTFVHSKVMLTEKIAVVGSINMDLRSFYQQFECSIYTDDIQFRQQVLADFDETLLSAVQLSDKDKKTNKLLYRIFVSLMQLVAPFM